MRRNKKILAENLIAEILTFLIVLVILLPVFWIVITSFKKLPDIVSPVPKFVFEPTLDNYISAIRESPFLRYFLNSSIISVSTTALVLLLSVPASYGLYRFEFKLKQMVALLLLFSRMIFPVAVIIPFFVMFKQIGLIDNYLSVIIMDTVINLPLSIWLTGSFIQNIPKDFEEAAMLDGCTGFQAFVRVVLPMILPGLIPVSIIVFIFTWNELLFAMVLTGTATKTVTVGILNYIGYGQTEWGVLCAGTVIASLPVIIMAILIQKYFIRGFTTMVLKG